MEISLLVYDLMIGVDWCCNFGVHLDIHLHDMRGAACLNPG
jgi:hypothetical protein